MFPDRVLGIWTSLEVCQTAPASSSRLNRESSAAINGVVKAARAVRSRAVLSLFMVSPESSVVCGFRRFCG